MDTHTVGPVVAEIRNPEVVDAVLRAADKQARATGARLIIADCVLHAGGQMGPQEADPAALDRCQSDSERALKDRVMCVTGRGETEFELQRLTEYAARASAALARRLSASLLVVGPGFFGMLSARYARCPVLLVREAPPGPILAATDLSRANFPVLSAAIRVSEQNVERPLFFFHACEKTFEDHTHTEPMRTTLDRIRERLRSIASERNVDASVVAVAGDPVVELLRAASRICAGLLVLGQKWSAGPPHAPGITELALATVHCSVLLVPTQAH